MQLHMVVLVYVQVVLQSSNGHIGCMSAVWQSLHAWQSTRHRMASGMPALQCTCCCCSCKKRFWTCLSMFSRCFLLPFVHASICRCLLMYCFQCPEEDKKYHAVVITSGNRTHACALRELTTVIRCVMYLYGTVWLCWVLACMCLRLNQTNQDFTCCTSY